MPFLPKYGEWPSEGRRRSLREIREAYGKGYQGAFKEPEQAERLAAC